MNDNNNQIVATAERAELADIERDVERVIEAARNIQKAIESVRMARVSLAKVMAELTDKIPDKI
jgi:predicted transcriptional regulator